MKKYLIGLVALLALIACSEQASETTAANATEEVVATETVEAETVETENANEIDTEHTPENTLDWFATYTGTLPCASCEGIKTELVLNEDQSYKITEEYLDTDKEPVKTVVEGKFTWTENGSVVRLDGEMKDRSYRVAESYVSQLDNDGKVVEGELAEKYELNKKAEEEVENP